MKKYQPELLVDPIIQLDGDALDELELILGGLLGQINHRSADDLYAVISQAFASHPGIRRILLADPDGTPLAAIDFSEDSRDEHIEFTSVAPAEHGPGRALRLTTPMDSSASVALIDDIPTPTLLEDLKTLLPSGGTLLLLADSSRSRRKEYSTLLAELEAACRLVPGLQPAHLIAPPYCDDDSLLAALQVSVVHDARHMVQDSTGQGMMVMFSGLSGSGKSTLARSVLASLQQEHRDPVLLDGDDIRRFVSKGLGFSREDRETNVERIGWIGSRIAQAGGVALCAPIAPFAQTRQKVRQLARDVDCSFYLIHVSTALEICEERDRKGLYAKARAGLVKDFTGIDSPYEVPTDADLTLDLGILEIAEATQQVLQLLRS
ncbi:adenylyl-sulfate kinase [Glutamicibacter ardleyensis]|uniref:adenylyl-sulfate kinase n=1 Tax=Glutamicibacter ardleyensis TaxID=225894 RepID=UPI003FD4FF81